MTLITFIPIFDILCIVVLLCWLWNHKIHQVCTYIAVLIDCTRTMYVKAVYPGAVVIQTIFQTARLTEVVVFKKLCAHACRLHTDFYCIINALLFQKSFINSSICWYTIRNQHKIGQLDRLPIHLCHSNPKPHPPFCNKNNRNAS